MVAWVSLGEAEPADVDRWACGTTDFIQLQTRARQRILAPAVTRDGKAQARKGHNPVVRAALSATVWVLGQTSRGNWQDYFYLDAQCWERSDGNAWRPWRRRGMPAKPGLRYGVDPTLVLDAIPALETIEGRVDAITIRDCSTELVNGSADLRKVADRLESFLSAGSNRTRAQGWYERAPIKLWIDTTGLLRRISYAPLPPNRQEPLWRTL